MANSAEGRIREPVQMINATKAEKLAQSHGIISAQGVSEFKAGWTKAMRGSGLDPSDTSPAIRLGYKCYQDHGKQS